MQQLRAGAGPRARERCGRRARRPATGTCKGCVNGGVSPRGTSASAAWSHSHACRASPEGTPRGYLRLCARDELAALVLRATTFTAGRRAAAAFGLAAVRAGAAAARRAAGRRAASPLPRVRAGLAGRAGVADVPRSRDVPRRRTCRTRDVPRRRACRTRAVEPGPRRGAAGRDAAAERFQRRETELPVARVSPRAASSGAPQRTESDPRPTGRPTIPPPESPCRRRSAAPCRSMPLADTGGTARSATQRPSTATSPRDGSPTRRSPPRQLQPACDSCRQSIEHEVGIPRRGRIAHGSRLFVSGIDGDVELSSCISPAAGE